MSHKRGLALLVAYLRPQWPRVVLLTFLLLGTVAVGVGNPQILRHFIDTAVAGGSLSVLVTSAALFLAIGLLNQGLVVLTAYVSSNLAWHTTNRMRIDLVKHCLHLDMSFHHSHTAGELIERTDEDIATLTNLFSVFVLQILVNLLLLVCVLVVLFLLEWRLGLAMTVYALLVLFVLRSTRGAMTPAWVQASQARAELQGFVGEHVAGVVDIRSNGAIPYIMRRFYEMRRIAFRKQWRAHRISATVSGGTDILLICGSIGAFILGTVLFQAGAISLGTVYLVVTYAQLLVQPLQEIMSQIDDLQQAAASLQRIQELYDMRSTLRDGPVATLPHGPLAIAFDAVSFAYHPEVPVLEGITLRIEPGEVLGILGRTGSGKTTLTRLLFRLYDPTRGTIRLGGIDLKDARIAALRQRIALVTQEVQLFHASVRDNLAFFERDIPDTAIIAALHAVGLAAWYAALPRGLDTVITAAGGAEMGLSAGEAQLLAFARVFLRQPSVVVLDEASSRLDPATETSIEHALDALFADRTGVIIAHRLATIRRADKILILEGGRMCEYGTREELLRDPTSRLNHLLRVGLEEVQL